MRTIVVLIHEGGRTSDEQFDDAGCRNFSGRIKEIADRLDPEVDLIISGHTHQSYVCRYGGRLITSAGAEGRVVSEIDLTIDRRSGAAAMRCAPSRANINGPSRWRRAESARSWQTSPATRLRQANRRWAI